MSLQCDIQVYTDLSKQRNKTQTLIIRTAKKIIVMTEYYWKLCKNLPHTWPFLEKKAVLNILCIFENFNLISILEIFTDVHVYSLQYRCLLKYLA